MNKDDMIVLFVGVALVVTTSVVSYFSGMNHGVKANQQDAIRAGVAEYYLDANNERQFRWKAVKP